jgi:hypothetical protein
MNIIYLYVQLTAHQTVHFGLCTALISRVLALIQNYKCKASRAFDRAKLVFNYFLLLDPFCLTTPIYKYNAYYNAITGMLYVIYNSDKMAQRPFRAARRFRHARGIACVKIQCEMHALLAGHPNSLVKQSVEDVRDNITNRIFPSIFISKEPIINDTGRYPSNAL